MKPKEIYDLETVPDETIHWADSDVFFILTEKVLDDELFDYQAALEDVRIETLVKAKSEENDPVHFVAYWVITFDSNPVGIVRVVGAHEDGWDRYITNYPLFQAMVGYVQNTFTPGSSNIVVDENEDIKELDSLFGWEINPEAKNNMKGVKNGKKKIHVA